MILVNTRAEGKQREPAVSEAHVSPLLKQWGLLVLEQGSVRKDLDVSSCGDPRLLQPDHVSGKPHAQCSGDGKRGLQELFRP